MRNRDGLWQRHPRRIIGALGGPPDHLPDLVAGEPASLGELLGVDGDLLGETLREQPDQQARRKQRGLPGEIAHGPEADAGFLAHLAAHGLLQGFTRLDEAGQAREPGARAPPVAAEQRPIAVDREHDHDGVGAREVRRPAIRAAPYPAGRGHPGRRSALGAETMPCVPVEQRAGLGEDRRLAGGDRRGEGAHVDQLGVDVGSDVRPGRIDREMCAPVAEPEKDQRRAPLDLAAPRRHRLPIERGRCATTGERLQVAQREDARVGIVEQLADPLAVLSALADPIQRVAAEAVDVFLHWTNFTGRPVFDDRSIASISLWRWTARLKSTSKDPRPSRASAARAYAWATL